MVPTFHHCESPFEVETLNVTLGKMEFLPNELILKIAGYLCYEDVDSLRKVCSRFHCLLNTNELWQRLFVSKYQHNNLSAIESHLGFNYAFDEVSGDLIEPCLWLRRFVEEKTLVQNFNRVKYDEELVPCLESSNFIWGDDRFVFTCKISNYEWCYDQWNIEKKICEKDPLFFAFIEVRVLFFEVINDIAVLIQGAQPIVQVFKNVDGNFTETGRIDYNNNTDYTFSIGIRLFPKPIQKISIGSFNGRFFLGVICPHFEPARLYINVWDFTTMTLVTQTSITYKAEICKTKVTPIGTKFSFVTFTFDNETVCHYYCTEKHEIIEKTDIWSGIHFYFYDTTYMLKVHMNRDRSPEQIATLRINLWKDDIPLNDVKFETPSGAFLWMRALFKMPYYGIMQNQRGIGIVYIFDVVSSKSYRISLEYYVKNILFLPNDRILLNINSWSWEPFFYIYSIKKPQIIRSFHHLDLCTNNNSLTKFFVRQNLTGEIYIYHFW